MFVEPAFSRDARPGGRGGRVDKAVLGVREQAGPVPGDLRGSAPAAARRRSGGPPRAWARWPELAQAGERFWIATLRDEREWSLLLVEFEVLRPRARRGPAGASGQRPGRVPVREGADAIEAVAAASGERLAVPANGDPVATLALGNGIRSRA